MDKVVHGSNYREFAAPAPLAPFVECFWTHQAAQASHSVLPDTCIDIVFSPSSGLRIAGTMTRPFLAHASEDAFAGVRFRPAIARDFLSIPAHELSDKVLPLDSVWGNRARALEQRLLNASCPEEMLRCLRVALQPPPQVSAIQAALQFLACNAGCVPLQEISRHAGLGERQLRRRCLEETGVTPKQLARIARFRRACSFIHADSHRCWAGVAMECGYYDQAHFINEFQEFSGQTPGAYREQLSFCGRLGVNCHD